MSENNENELVLNKLKHGVCILDVLEKEFPNATHIIQNLEKANKIKSRKFGQQFVYWIESTVENSKPQQIHPTTTTIQQIERLDKIISDCIELKAFDQEVRKMELEYKTMLNEHLNRLHLYNDLKDIGTSLIGGISNITGATTKQLYEQFDLNLQD